ncbi:MAG: zinc ABC transporter substrate-binding protein [Salinisphaera sp.]|nr:zinc ABC transporter substrate-binding protein [Salinisphaera sp.]
MLGLFLIYWLVAPQTARAEDKIHAVAAESSYGSMVESIGGDHVDVISLLDSPSVNPHQFEGSPRIGRQLQNADLVVMNGLGFDGWMAPLLKGTSSAGRQVIKASDTGSAMIMADNNPHLFYSPQIMLATASRVAKALTRMDPAHADDYRANLHHFQAQLLPIYAQVQTLIAAHPNLAVTATVPVYAYMIKLLGYRDRYHDIQFASMDNSQPSAQQVKQFTQALQNHKVALLIYNKQVHNRLTQSEVGTARKAGIPAVGVSAIPLHGEDYAQWQISQLQAIEKALAAHAGS